MLIHNKTNNSFAYFIHIPRTGGRFVNSIFRNDSNYNTFFDNHRSFYKNKEVPHLTYPDYLNLDKYFINYNNTKLRIGDINHFTIVRNPFNKFKSELKRGLKSEEDLLYVSNLSKSELEKLIYTTIENSNCNWFVSQSSFISPQTKIWKFEDGYNLQFVNWIKEHLNFDIRYLNVEYKKAHYDYTELNFDVLEKIKPFIEEIYKEDYDRFEYQKDT